MGLLLDPTPAGRSTILILPRGLAPRTPPHALSRARCVGALRSRGSLARSLATQLLYGIASRSNSGRRLYHPCLTERLSPSDSPPRSLARPLRRRAPFAWLARALARDPVAVWDCF